MKNKETSWFFLKGWDRAITAISPFLDDKKPKQ